MAPELCRLIADCRLSLRESSATFAERKATISTTQMPLGSACGSPGEWLLPDLAKFFDGRFDHGLTAGSDD